MITIFTPTYNRKKLLHRAFLSLNKQTDNNFIWMIVDDGSNDDTDSMVKEFQKEAKFKIVYYYKENGGKHTAHNLAVSKCETTYMMILDSDDVLSDKAIEILNEKIKVISKNETIAGIIGNQFELRTGRTIGNSIPDIKYASGIELYQKYGFKGDTLRLYKTKVLKEYLFPIFETEKFMPENVVFDKIDTKYKMLIIKEKLYFTEYQEDGISNKINEIRVKNYHGYSLSLKSMAETAVMLKKKIGITIIYIMWSRKFKIKGRYKNFNKKLLYLLCIPITYIFQLIKFPDFYYEMFKDTCE